VETATGPADQLDDSNSPTASTTASTNDIAVEVNTATLAESDITFFPVTITARAISGASTAATASGE